MIPAVLHILKFKITNVINKSICILRLSQSGFTILEAETKMSLMRIRQDAINSIVTSFKMTEHIFENFVQLGVITSVLLTATSDTGTMDLKGVDRILRGEGSMELLRLLSSLSYLSLIKGHMDMVKSKKKGFSSIVGTLLQLAYFSTCIAARYEYPTSRVPKIILR